MSNIIYVIETSDNAFLGTVEFVEGGLLVRNGFVGRPTFIDGADLVKLVPAEEHPDVEVGALLGFDSNEYFWVG